MSFSDERIPDRGFCKTPHRLTERHPRFGGVDAFFYAGNAGCDRTGKGRSCPGDRKSAGIHDRFGGTPRSSRNSPGTLPVCSKSFPILTSLLSLNGRGQRFTSSGFHCASSGVSSPFGFPGEPPIACGCSAVSRAGLFCFLFPLSIFKGSSGFSVKKDASCACFPAIIGCFACDALKRGKTPAQVKK